MVDIAQQGEFANLIKQRLQQPQIGAPIVQPPQGEFGNLIRQTLLTRQQTQPITTEQPATVIQPQQEIETLSDEQINQLTPEAIEGLAPEQKQRLLVKKLAQLSPAEKTILSLGSGFANIARGVRSLAATATGDEQALAEIERGRQFQQQVSQEFRQEQPILTPIAEIGGEVLATVGAPFGAGATIPARIASTAATGATLGAVSAAGRGDDVVGNALLGAGLGAGFQGLTEGGKALARRIINAKQGRFANNEIKELIEVGKKEGIDIFTEDVAVGGLLKRLGTISEDIPFSGTVKARLKQAQQQKTVAESLRDSITKDVDDIAQEAQGGLQRRLTQIKKRTSQLFTEAANELNPLGNIPTSKFDNEIKNQVQLELAKRRPDEALVSILESFKGEPGNFSFTRELLSELNDEISQFFKGGREAIGEKGSRSLLSIKRALENDLDDFVAKEGGQAGLQSFSKAKRFFAARQAPFINSKLGKLVKTDEPEQIAGFILSKGVGKSKGIQSRAKTLFNSLDNKGRDAIRAAMIDHAFKKALSPEGRLSAQKFANALDEFEDVRNVFIKGADKNRINGLVKLFRATSRASQIAENPPTGRRIIPLLTTGAAVGGIATGNILATISVLGGINLTSRFLLRSDTGKSLLLGLNKTTAGTKAFENQLQKINNFLTRVSVAESPSE